MKALIGVALVVLSWWIASHAFDVELILPTPEETVSRLIDLLSDVSIYRSILSTFLKGVISSALLVAFGIPLGFSMGLSETIYEMIRPAIVVIQAVPVISWLALVIFTVGIGWKGPVLITFLSLLPIVALNTAEGVKRTDSDLLEMARVYGVGRLKVIRYIYLGSVLPFVLASLNLIAGNVWKVVLVAEFLCGERGIGVEISWARTSVDVPGVYALTLIGVGMGMSFERLVRFVTGRLERRWGFC